MTSTSSYADATPEYRIKAAFIYNFARFTQWPDDNDEIRICIYGKDPFGSEIDSLNGKVSNGRKITIERTQLIEDVRSCHIVYLNIIPPERHLYEQALKEINGSNVLTVSDASNVIDFGVMIGMNITNNKISFDVNHNATTATDLVISAKLLRLAREIN
jgi:hypothetical protein